MLAALGAGLLLVIGVGALSRLLLVRPVERLSRDALLVAAGKPGPALGWRRRDAIGSRGRDDRRARRHDAGAAGGSTGWCLPIH